MTHHSSDRHGRASIALLAIGLLLLLGAGYWLSQRSPAVEDDQTVLVHRVARSDFEAFVTEPGDAASSSNVDIRCQVESRGSAGVTLVKIVDEGTYVNVGDFLAQFDDSVLQNELIAQKIVSANDKSSLIQAKSDLQNAERTSREYENGLFQQEVETLESAVFVAEEEYRKKDLDLKSNRRLAARGVINKLQVSAAEFAVEKAKKDVDAAKRALEVYRKFTKERLVGEYKAEIEKQAANVEAATYTLELSQQKLADIETQIDNCMISAPAAGQVVYASERSRGEPVVIEEGAVIRKNQLIIRLPDIRKMQVDVKINESHINKIKLGQPARIEFDADPEHTLIGKVRTVAPYPFPMRWHGAPLEYGVEVAITDPPPTIRPGLRAKVRIYFDSEPDVLQVPLASIITHDEGHFVLVRQENDWRPQQVTIGPNNNNVVVIRSGVAQGEMVALTPFRYIDRPDLPAPNPSLIVPSDEPEQLTVSESSAADAKTGS